MRCSHRSIEVVACTLLLAASIALCGESRLSPGHWMVSASADTGASAEAGSIVLIDSSGKEVPGGKMDLLDLGINLQVGYFFVGGLEIGPAVQVGYSCLSDPDDSSHFVKITSRGLGAQVGYFHDMGTLGTYGKVVGLLQSTSLEEQSGDMMVNSSQSGFQVIPEAGVLLFPGTGIALQAGAYLNYSEVKDHTSQVLRTISYGIKVGFSVFF
jgi:hypothetical protein